MQRTFHVLPTDPRFTDLTEEQMVLLFEHMKLDKEEANESIKTQVGVTDEDYNSLEGEHDKYDDPDFGGAWNSDEEYDKELQRLNEVIDENGQEDESEGKGQDDYSSDFSLEDEWEEVE